MDKPSSTKFSLESIGPCLEVVFGRFPGIVAGYLFGSYVRGEETPWSDLDLAVLYRGKVVLAQELRLSRLVADVLGGREVDIVSLNGKPVTFQFEVLSTGSLIYDPYPEEEIEFRWSVTRRYLDIKPTLDLFWKQFDHYLKEDYLVGGK